MMPALLYCPACGAANAPDHDLCFACQQPLALHVSANMQTSLLHNRYQMLTQVGTGGFGAVYKALDTRDRNRLVAIKQINLRGLTPQEVIEATDGFNREVRMLSTLSHAHLPRIYTHFTDPEHWYVVMDFIVGENLEHYLRDITSAQENAIRALALDEIIDIGLQLCSVLAYLHTRQPVIIFRDLKPSNIMRTPQGQLYVIDFGTARYFKPGQTRDTIPLGSPGYAAPEQYGRAQTTPRADIYSLGALLHHLLSLHDPSETPFTFAPLRLASSAGMSELATLVARMVELEVGQRPGKIAEVETELRRIRQLRVAAEPRIWRPVPGKVQPPVLAPGAYRSPQVLAAAAQKRKTRRKFILGGLGVASSLALGGGVPYWLYWHPTRLVLEPGFPQQIPVSNSAISTIAWSLDGRRIAFGLSDGSIVGYQLSLNNGFTLNPTFVFAANAAAQPVTLLAWSPDQAQLAAVSQVGLLQVWNVNSRQNKTISIGSGNIKAIVWSANGQRLAVTDDQGGLYLCDPRNGGSSPVITTGLVSDALAWLPYGTSLIAERSPNALTIMDIVDEPLGQSLASIPLNAYMVHALALSPDGQYIAALSVDGTLQVWDHHNNDSLVFSRLLATQQKHLAWSPDNRFLTAIDDTNRLLVLNRSTGDTLVSAPIFDSLGRGSIFPGRALTWLSDGQHIAVASSNMECWLWALPWL